MSKKKELIKQDTSMGSLPSDDENAQNNVKNYNNNQEINKVNCNKPFN